MIYKAIGSGRDFNDLVVGPGPEPGAIIRDNARKPAHVKDNAVSLGKYEYKNLELMRRISRFLMHDL